MSEINANKIDKATGSTLTVGDSGTTVNIAGTAGTGFPTPTSGIAASAIDSGTIATARLGSGTASSSTFLRGDQTYAAAGGNSKLFEGTFGSQTSGNISLSSIGFTPNAVHCIFCPNATTNATDVDNISMGFGVKTGATSSDMAVAYNYYQQSGTSAFDANPNVIGRLAFGGAAFHELTITAWNSDDCTLTKTALNTPANVTLKYAIMVTG
jgi:hypothetical protein